MNIVIIQARMGSTRLPGKVLMDLDGDSVLEFMVKRVQKSILIDRVVVATTVSNNDNLIEKECKKIGVSVFRGSEQDVLDRYYKCAKKHNANNIIRLTSDCPLIDPAVIDETIELFNETKVDYAANTAPPEQKKFPDGSDVEVFSFKSLEKAWINALDKKDREHVTFFFWKYENSEFSTAQLDNDKDWGKYRITLDYEEDFVLIKEIIRILKVKNLFGSTNDIIDIIDTKGLFEINSMHTWGANW